MGRQIRIVIIYICLFLMFFQTLNTSVSNEPDKNSGNVEFGDEKFQLMNSPGLYNGLINYTDVLLVINNNSAVSIEVGTYFARQRGIPEENICNISTQTTETINSAAFNDLRSKIENHINWNGLKTKINYIVTTKGVPLRVDYGGGSRACVDSELMLILGAYSNRIGGGGRDSNPYFGDNQRFAKKDYDMYLVTRLTGYTVEEIKGYIDLAANSYGKRGMFMLDVSPGKDGSPGYKIGNDWMRNAYTILNNKGYNVTLDQTNPFITGIQNVSGYCSWGSNDGAYSTNHISNSNLETDSNSDQVPDGWYIQADSGDQWSRNQTEVQAGSWSMKLERPYLNGNFSALGQNITVKPGVRYYAAGYINISNVSGSGTGAYLSISARDQSDNVLQYFNGSARRWNTGSFTALSQIHYEPIEGVTKITVSVVVLECSGTFHFDNIRLYEIKPHNSYVPGAIAETYVSTGGRSFTYPTSYGQSLIADMIREGVTGVKGYVYEPYLDAIAHPDILFDRYTAGYNLAESYYMASQYISWMDVVVGDPKVSPYINELAELSASTADINFSINQPSEGDSVTITGTVHNTGTRTASGIKSQLYLGMPGAGGITLGAPKEMTISSGEFGQIEYTWETTYLNGWYNIYLEFDFENKVMEQTETNNLVNRTIYINARPVVENIKLNELAINRNHSLYIIVNGSDVETPESELFCSGQFKHEEDSGGNAWQHFSAPTYSGQFWRFNFTANISSRLGGYDIRFRFSDNHSEESPGVSEWMIRSSAFKITNNKPFVKNMKLSKSEIFRTENVTIIIEAGDIETANENIVCNLEVKMSADTSWRGLPEPFYKNGHWVAEYIPAKDDRLGAYDFKAYIKDDEAIPARSDYLVLTEILLVKNNPAKVTNLSIDGREVLRLKEIDVIVKAGDVEDKDEDLSGFVEYRSNSSSGSEWKALSKFTYRLDGNDGYWITTFEPDRYAALGFYDFRAKFIDMDGEGETWFSLDRAVMVTNNLPVIDKLEVSTNHIILNNSVFISATGYDLENTKSELVCTIEITPSASAEWFGLQVKQLTSRWEAEFKTDKTSETGFYDVRARLIDPDIRDSPTDYDLDLLWTVSKNAFFIRKGFPELNELRITPGSIKTGESTTIEISSSGNLSENAELACLLQYQTPDGEWNSISTNFDNTKGTGVWLAVLLAEDTKEPGEYKFRVQLISPNLGTTDWLYPDATLNVEKEPEKRGNTPSSLTAEILLLLIMLIAVVIAIIVIVAIVLLRRKKAGKVRELAEFKAVPVEVMGDWQTPEQVRQSQVGLAQGVIGSTPAGLVETTAGFLEPLDAEVAALPAAGFQQPGEFQEPLEGEIIGSLAYGSVIEPESIPEHTVAERSETGSESAVENGQTGLEETDGSSNDQDSEDDEVEDKKKIHNRID